jgi:hypothetical protein
VRTRDRGHAAKNAAATASPPSSGMSGRWFTPRAVGRSIAPMRVPAPARAESRERREEGDGERKRELEALDRVHARYS